MTAEPHSGEIDPMVRRSTHPTGFYFAPSCRFRARGEQGSAIVETALSMIILLTVMFGVVEICLALYSYHIVSDAAREGTRFAMVRGSACTAPGNPCPATATDIQNHLHSDDVPGFNTSLLKATTVWSAYPAGGICSPSATCNNPGNQVTVTVTYKFPLSIPFVPSSSISMSSTSAMIISQ